ncbi:hypothetical protein L226DRAFT_543692 [Lentinus tigrinus ALCF2SS1-7]|uniref:uncharacterized protein n=1 Tax=Lentinus tigrinus ALCF2SS1-7 TaxID=1328758 RepID=UPI0011661C3C|nr:hypothetical protein L226DRAFT_543692 [Lentinus tigrinus ALCF2SS1-7]
MPAKAHRPSGQVRSHSRSSSGGSSKLGLNLQFTQKDPPPPRVADKAKKSAHFHHEPNARAANAQFMRSNSGIRVHSRENLQPAAIRRAPTPNTAAKQNGAKQKPDFSISSPDEGEDDDEWVSSESGAATPNNESDAETTPIEQAKPRPAAQPAPVQAAQQTQVNATFGHDVATPKAVPPSLPRVDTARPSQLPLATPARDYASNDQKPPQLELSSRPSDQPRLQVEISSPTPPVSKARSETHSPPRRSPDIDSAYKRQSMTRPPSTHSVTSPTLRPHPLIRGHSYAHGFAVKPAPLAPLTTVLPDNASGQMSTTSSSPTSHRAGSPTSIRTASASPSLSSPSSSSPAHKQLRRTSTSSVASSATMPVQSSASEKLSSRSNHDRQRTLSTISSSSSIAALTNFALRSTPSPPRTPITFTSHFPPQEQSAALEVIHPLLPPPYLSAHLTVLAYRNPIAESYDRVIRAKQRR